MASNDETENQRHPPDLFATTHWTVVLEAGTEDTSKSLEALGKLCKEYWYPLYVFVRSRGFSVEDAQDLTQEFFTQLLRRQDLSRMDRSKGKFRAFLLAAMKHFLANHWQKAKALKRGGGQEMVPLDTSWAENQFKTEIINVQSPDSQYDRSWALELLRKVLASLREDYREQGKEGLFSVLKATLSGNRTSLSYAEIGDQLGMREGAVKVAVHRLRKRYRQLLRREISQTVATESQIDEEMKDLMAAIS